MNGPAACTFYRLLLALWVLATLPLPAWSLSQPVQPEQLPGAHELARYLRVSPPGVAYANPDLALAAYRSGQFQAFDPFINQGFQASSAWLAFDLAASSQQRPDLLMLQVGPAHLDKVVAYLAMPDGSLRLLGLAGDHVPANAKALPYLKATFALRAPDQPGHSILIRIDNHSSHAAYTRLFKASQFPDVATRHGLLLGILLTLGVLILTSALWLYQLLQQRLYLLWSAYSATQLALLLLNNGLISLYLPAWPDTWTNPLADALMALGLASGGAFLANWFWPGVGNTPFTLAVRGWCLMLTALGLLIPWWGNAQLLQLVLLLALPALVLALAALVRLMLKRQPLALGIGPPLLLYLGATLLYLLALLGLGFFSISFYWFWNILGFLLLLVVQIALFVQALASQRSSQAERNRQVRSLTHRNQALEDKVKARTRDLEQALREVQQAEAEQRQLLSMASHEFRTPAAMIKTSLDSLRFLSDRIPPEVNSRLDNIRLASQRLALLTNSLIVDNRLREPRLQSHPAPTLLNSLVQEVVAGYPESTPIRLNLPAEPVWLPADAALLSIALHNLIDNALHHGTTARPSIEVRVALEPGTVVLAVADNGPGIPDAEKEKVFERFRRRNASRGSGLGLSIVHAIVQAHRGTIQVTDNTPTGTRMTIRLPSATPTAEGLAPNAPL